MGDLAIITTFGIRIGDRIDGIGGNASAQNLDLFFENIFFSHIVWQIPNQQTDRTDERTDSVAFVKVSHSAPIGYWTLKRTTSNTTKKT